MRRDLFFSAILVGILAANAPYRIRDRTIFARDVLKSRKEVQANDTEGELKVVRIHLSFSSLRDTMPLFNTKSHYTSTPHTQVLMAGSKEFYNYRHQADVAHAYWYV